MMPKVLGLASTATMSIIYLDKILKESLKLTFPKEHSNKPFTVGSKVLDRVSIGLYCSD